VSSHLLIKRDGEIVQFVPFNKCAWHAGVSEYQGRTSCNDFSIGIELEGTDDIPYDECQYKVLNEVVRCLCDSYPDLKLQHVVGHCHIAPARKTDPGLSFNWVKLKGLLGCD